MPTLIPAWTFDHSPIPDPHGRAARVLEFADLLRHPSAEGEDRRPLKAHWQRRIIQRIYGPSTDDGRRQVRVVFILLPRGARKTTLAAVLALAHTIGPEQRRMGQVISAAGDRSQARIAFEEASAMVLEDDIIVDATRISDSKNKITHRYSRSVYSAVSADGDRHHGKTPWFIIADELHVWRGEKGTSLWNALRTGAAKAPGSLTVVITTAGERPEGLCWDIYQYALKVLAKPELNPSFLPIIFQADDKADWQDEELWHTVNPGLADGFPDIAELRSEAQMARFLPKLRAAFLQTHLNIWPDGSAAGWVEMDVYDEGAAPIDIEALRGRKCFVGVDLSQNYDLAAVVAVFPDEDGGFTVVPRCYLPETTLKQRAEESDIPWDDWREAGHLIAIPGDLIDEDVIEQDIRALCATFDVQEIGFDPKFAAKLVGRLQEDGLPAVSVEQKPATMGPHYHRLQRMIIGRKFRHGGHPVLRHCVQNATPIYGPTGLPYLTKKKRAVAIDAVVAAAIGLGLAETHEPSRSIFDGADFDPENFVMR